jgi:formylglycine-generating enzyme required for sulfatase activity
MVKDEQTVERFRREVEAAAKLSHPNIVTAHDAEQAGDTHFLVMEFVEGISLAELVAKQGPLPVPQACGCIRQAALGLQHAHERGMVHRDVKPQNLMLTPASPIASAPGGGIVKLLDFGLARFVSETPQANALTRENAVMGTPVYMAPEQACDAHAAGIRADIYSLGCTTYFLLTGDPPFAGATAIEYLAKHLTQEPTPIETLRPEVPTEVAAIVRKMMAKKPEERYQTPAEVAQALEPFAEKSGDSATWPGATVPTNLAADHQPLALATIDDPDRMKVQPGHKRRRLFLVALGLAGVLLSSVGLLVLTASSKPQTTGAVAAVSPSGANKQSSVTSTTGSQETRATLPSGPSPKFEPLPGKEYITNSIGMRLVKVPAGKFMMGSPRDENQRQTDEDQHEAEITRPFYLGIFTVTQEQYEKVMKSTPSWFSATGLGTAKVKGMDTRHFPVETVGWFEANDFCGKLSAFTEEKKSGRSYRLPTETEWEYSCRGGATTYSPFHFGNTLTSDLANFNGNSPYPDTAKKGAWLERPTTVGSYKPNGFGLYDMHGNVWQWCADWYGPYDPSKRKDPTGPDNGTARVLRGGNWSSVGRYCRSAHRYRSDPGYRTNLYFAFRVVCVVP